MSSQVMCFCPTCKKNTIGIKTGLTAGGHVFNLVLVFLTGLLWCLPYLIIALCSSTVRCSSCGNKADKL